MTKKEHIRIANAIEDTLTSLTGSLNPLELDALRAGMIGRFCYALGDNPDFNAEEFTAYLIPQKDKCKHLLKVTYYRVPKKQNGRD